MKISDIEFQENPPSESRVVAYEQTNRWTEISKLIGVLLNYANTAKRGIAHTSQKTVFSLFKNDHSVHSVFLCNRCLLFEPYAAAIYKL